jgi:hypothetical protein
LPFIHGFGERGIPCTHQMFTFVLRASYTPQPDALPQWLDDLQTLHEWKKWVMGQSHSHLVQSPTRTKSFGSSAITLLILSVGSDGHGDESGKRNNCMMIPIVRSS